MNDDGAPKDHAEEPDYGEPGPLEENIKSRATWLRLFFMLVILLLWGVSRFVTGAVVFIQFFWVLFTGETNTGLRHLGRQLAIYSYEIILYLTFNAEERPFPFDLDWPGATKPPGPDQ
jgi:hypothetical protein